MSPKHSMLIILSADKDLDGSGMCVLPGLVDGHTHPVWAGDRVHEFAMKLAGATYLDIHKAWEERKKGRKGGEGGERRGGGDGGEKRKGKEMRG